MNVACANCTAELDHCHGTLLEHHDGAIECTEGDCANLDQLRHDLMVTCESIVGECGCEISEPLAAVA